MCCGNKAASKRTKFEVTFTDGSKVTKSSLGAARIAASRDPKAVIKTIEP